MTSRTCSCLLLTVFLLLPGCGGKGAANRPPRVPAGGLVTHKGTPVEGAVVVFQPLKEGMPGAVAKTDAEGRFDLQTFDPKDGAVPGEYKVTIQKVEVTTVGVATSDDAEVESTSRSLLPASYANPETSGLTASVADDGGNDFLFSLEGEAGGTVSRPTPKAVISGE